MTHPRRSWPRPKTHGYALGSQPAVRMTEFPFKVGRENRRRLEKLQTEVDRRLGGVPLLNDLYLLEPSSGSLHISRNT